MLTDERLRFLKFCTVGAGGVPVNLALTWIGFHLLFSGMGEELRHALSFVLGIGVSIFTNFVLNDMWTWRDRTRRGAHPASGFSGRLVRFYLVSAAGASLQFGTAMALSLWLDLHYLLAQVCGIALATAVNFGVNNVWTYRKTEEPDDPS